MGTDTLGYRRMGQVFEHQANEGNEEWTALLRYLCSLTAQTAG